MSRSALFRLIIPSLILSLVVGATVAQDPQQAGEIPSDSQAGESAAPERPSAPPRAAYESPRATMFTFLDGMNRWRESGRANEAALDQAVEALDLSSVEADRPERIEQHALQLWGVLNRLGEVQEYQLPAQDAVQSRGLERFSYYPGDSEGGLPRFDLIEQRHPQGRIAFTRTPNGEWRFSAETIEGISEFYSAVEELPVRYGEDERALSFPLWLRSQVPAPLRQGELLTLEYWQWIGLFLVIFLGVLFDLVARAVAAAISNRIIQRRGGDVSNETTRRMVRPVGLVVAGLFWLWAINALLLPDVAYAVLIIAIQLIVMIAGVWTAFRITDLVGEALASKAAATHTKVDDLLIPLLRKTAKVFIAAFGLIYIAESFDIEILPLLTGLGIGGLAVAFAAKDTIENFFGSIAVIVDRPFEVGDWIKTGDVEGTVEELGFRSTRVRTFYNSLVTIPNAALVRATVDNYGRRKYRRYNTHVSVTYDTPPEKIEAFCEGIREIIRLHPYTRKDYYQVWMHQFAASSLDVLVYMFFESPDWTTEMRERHRFILDIIRLANQLGVEFAFPTQTLHVLQDEGDGRTEPAPPPGGGTESAAQRQGRVAAQRLTAEASWRDEKPPPYQFSHSTTVDEDDETQIESKTGGDE